MQGMHWSFDLLVLENSIPLFPSTVTIGLGLDITILFLNSSESGPVDKNSMNCPELSLSVSSVSGTTAVADIWPGWNTTVVFQSGILECNVTSRLIGISAVPCALSTTAEKWLSPYLTLKLVFWNLNAFPKQTNK